MRLTPLILTLVAALSLAGCGRSAEEKDYLDQISRQDSAVRDAAGDDDLVRAGKQACNESDRGLAGAATAPPLLDFDFSEHERAVIFDAAQTYLCR